MACVAKSYHDPAAPGVDVRVRDTWISDEAYTEVVGKMPISCTDAVPVKKGDQAVYLGMRSVYPMRGVWCLGGRIFFNDTSLEHSVARCLHLETGVHFDPGRFEYVCTNLYSWVRTAQGNFPGKNLAVTYKLEVTQKELEEMARGLKPEEYDPSFGLQRFDRARLVDERAHPAMLDFFDKVFPRK